MTAPGCTMQRAPIVVPASSVTRSAMRESVPSVTRGPTMECAPTEQRAPITAPSHHDHIRSDGGIGRDAGARMPAAPWDGHLTQVPEDAAARRCARRWHADSHAAAVHRLDIPRLAATQGSPPARRVLRNSSSSAGLARKPMACGPPDSVATEATRLWGSPRSAHPKRTARFTQREIRGGLQSIAPPRPGFYRAGVGAQSGRRLGSGRGAALRGPAGWDRSRHRQWWHTARHRRGQVVALRPWRTSALHRAMHR